MCEFSGYFNIYNKDIKVEVKTMENYETVMNRAIDTAEKWQRRATELVSDFDREFHAKMQTMLANPLDKVLLIELMDQAFRSEENNARVADQILFLLEKYGMAAFFTNKDRLLLWMFKNIGKYLPDFSVPMFINQIRDDTKAVVIQGEDEIFNKHLQMRKAEGTRVNINLIGEVVLGEEEAEERIEKYMNALANPNIDYISIKISTIFSQINVLSLEETVETLIEKLSRIFRQAQKYSFRNKNGEMENKFINLDMEEYRDLAITVDMFKRTLDKEEFKNFKAGIVLQAYLPDSHIWQKNLVEWAKERIANGGAPIKMRLVKGANMEMEETEHQLRHWEMVTFTNKIDTDSNYKIMARYALEPENIKAVNMGFASHNLFELAHAYELAKENNVLEYFSFEMLEGMSESSRLAIKELSGEVILYAPTAKKEQFTNAIAYLVRRLDENTGPENFIRYSFGLTVGSPDWESQKAKFKASFENIKNINIAPKRVQNRLAENWDAYEGGAYYTKEYHAEADTDFIMPENQEWARGIRQKWMRSAEDEVFIAPIVVAGEEITKDRDIKDAPDKSQLKEGVLAGRFANANAEDLKRAVEVAKADVDGWRSLSHEERFKALSKVANVVRKKRDDLIGIAAAEVGKVFTETDVEVSEAVDFLEFYPYSVRYFEEKYPNLKFSGKGVGLVVPPWNFPIAIPLGGIAAALAAGNTVIIKPASVAALCSYEMCKCFWEAGISKNVLQFVPCPGRVAGENLIANKDIDFVILTGGEDTALSMLETRPELFLTAETGGKDATIVTNMADRDQAVKNVCNSAFLNSGQKCSATSLLVLEEDVYNDANFKKALVDTAASMDVGSVWDLKNRIGTLANPVDGALKRAVESLDSGEEWALAPSYSDDNEYMLRPAIRWGVKENNFCHKTELFGPVLSVMCAKDLKHAVHLVNSTGYGLTSGIESLDEREVNYWRENLKAGNLYINRGTTGAIVLRQPFGGMGKSSIGAGRKVGVHNYFTQFVDFTELDTPKVAKSYGHKMANVVKSWQEATSQHTGFAQEFKKLALTIQSYLEAYENEFSKEHDFFKIRGEDNIFRYLSLKKVALRVCKSDSLFDVITRIAAAKICKVSLRVSIEEDAQSEVISFLYENKDKLLESADLIVRESEEAFVKCFATVDRILYAKETNISEFVFKAANKEMKFIVRNKAYMEGRIELLNYVEEQSVSHSYHRYGNIGARAIK